MISPTYLGEGGEGGAAFVQSVEAKRQADAAAIGARQRAREAAPAARASAPAQLQNALRALGVMAGDPTLMKVKVDGVIGPATVKAVNYAIAHVTGPLPYFAKPNLNVGNVRQYAGGLATTLTQYIQQRGGTVPPPQVQKAVHHVSSGGGAISIPLPEPESDRKWIWYAVGGGSLLLVLALAASVVKKKHHVAAEA